VRNHHATPQVNAGSWTLRIDGAVVRPLSLGLAELRARRHRTLAVVLECAGNGRSRLDPPTPGLPWGDGAVGCVRVAGVPLADVLLEAGLRGGVHALVGIGADGEAEGPDGFERAIPRKVALHPDTLLVDRMNGRPLSIEHGGPVRLLVPGWYGMASLKWITRLTAVTDAFEGTWQTQQYVYRGGERRGPSRPVERIRVRSTILTPEDGSTVEAGRRVGIAGRAWSDSGVARVRVSVDDGATWSDARLGRLRGPYAWRAWSFVWTPIGPGTTRILARATDGRGRSQPFVASWNELGYGNNAVESRTVRVVPGHGRERARSRPQRRRPLKRAAARPRDA